MKCLLEKDWKIQRAEVKSALIKHRTSASSLSTYKMCRRKWWLNKIRKLVTRSSQANIIGTITHSVCERYLEADDQGYIQGTRTPVELFPEGWHIALNTYPKHIEECVGHTEHKDHVQYASVDCDCPHPVDGELTIQEQAMVRRLISEAIDGGILERHPRREVEKEIFFDAFHDEKLGDLSWIGYIDVREPDMIQDHKTTSRMKYALSKAKLFDNLQMNLYGYHSVFVRPDADPDLEALTFRHNVYCKDPNDSRVRRTEVEKPVAEIKGYYDREIEPCFKDMLLLIKNTDTWSDIEPPADIAGSCNAYGGCPFLSICSGGETTDMYIKRVDRISNSVKKQSAKTQNHKERPEMSLLDKKTKKTPAPAAPKTPAPETVKDEVPVTDTPSNNAAPWYVDGCKACSDNPNLGIGSNGQPCMVCVSKSMGKVNVADYKQEVGEDGSINWVNIASGETVAVDTTEVNRKVAVEEKVGGADQVAAETEAKAETVRKKKESQKTADAEAKKAKEEAPVVAKEIAPVMSGDLPSQAPLDLDPKPEAYRKKFTLIIGGTAADGTMSNASALGNAGRIITLEELMKIVGQRMGELYAAKMGKDDPINYFDINAFERRDFLCAHAEEISELLGNSTLACSRTPTPDENTMLSALRPYAARVFVCSP